MILFVNGNEHVAGAKITNNFIYADEDPRYGYKGKRPHQDNLKESWGAKLANILAMKLDTVAPQVTNAEIIKSTNKWIDRVANRLSPDDVFIVIGWNILGADESAIDIRNYHLYLNELQIRHIFFNTDIHFELDFNFRESFVQETYIGYIKSTGSKPVIMSKKYYSTEAHSKWANYLLKHIVKYKML